MHGSTQNVISDTRPTVGRPKINEEAAPGRFPAGTLARIKAVLRDGENQSDFIRAAVAEELKRREKS